jgi:hypothetical protein
MKEEIVKVLTMIHATAEIIVDYQRTKGFKDYPVTIMALAITSMCRWELGQIEKEKAPEPPRE